MNSRSLRFAASFAAVAGILASSASCDSTADVCTPGAQTACPCPGGVVGAQACDTEGSGFESCICPDDGSDPGAGGSGGEIAMGGQPGTGGIPSDGGAPPGNGGNNGEGGEGGEGGAPTQPACYQDFGLDYDVPGDDTRIGLGLCSPFEIERFYSECLGNMSSGETCDDFVGLYTECSNCILAVDPGGNSAGSTPVLFLTSDGEFILANTLGCEAAAQGEPDCGGVLADLALCRFTACHLCDGSDFGWCFDHAVSPEGVCGQEIYVPAHCQPIVDNPVQSPECSGSTFQATYTNIATYFCGPP